MALYTYEINSDWTYVEDKGLPGLWYGYKHVKFEEDTTYHTQTNYYRFSVFMKTGDIYAQYKDENYNVKSRVSIPATIKGYRLKTYWHLPNSVNSTIQVEGIGSVSVSKNGTYVPVWLEGGALTAQNPPEGFTQYSKVRYLLNDVEIVANCNDTYGAGQLGFQIESKEASTGTNWTDEQNVYQSQFLTTLYTANGYVDGYYSFIRHSGAIVGSVGYTYLPYKKNARPNSISSSINLTTGKVAISFSTFPVAATGFKSSIGSLIYNLNTNVNPTSWLDSGREIPAEYFEGSGATPFSFTLTEAERARLFELADEFGELDESTGQISMRINWYVYTAFYAADGETEIYIAENQTANYITLVGRPPLVEGEVYDVNEKTLALTGDKDTLIRYHSTAHFDIRGEALDAATLEQLSVSNAGGIIAGESGEFTNVESNIFYLNAIDNRGNTSRVEVVKGWIEYVKLTANIKSNEVSADGFASITISGNYYGGSFGAESNSLTLSVRYKTSDTEYGEWVSITPTLGESNTYEHTIELEGLDYMETYTFQAKAQDKLEEILSAEKVFTTIPVFDWGHDDFNFNVPVTIMGKRIGGDNTILWNGSEVMTADVAIELSEPISSQNHGVALVFSAADGDVSWNVQYVPKAMVNLLNGGGMAFILAPNAALGKFAAKYLYIEDAKITGDPSNEATGTGASSIAFSNADFVLRYVIGV